MKVITAPNPILRTKTKPVKKITPELIKTAKEMIKLTKTFTDPEGVGLSANQISRLERFFVVKLGGKPKDDFIPKEKADLLGGFIICFNPKILSFGKKERIFLEGCLSVPDYYAEVSRPQSVRVSFENEAGETVKKSLRGFSALVFQHETDHLNGILFIDRALEQRSRIFKIVGKDRAESDILEEVKLA